MLTKINKNLVLLLIILLAGLLRFYNLAKNPPSLYWEEVALGYDAYSLLKTGRDHRGNSWPLFYLESFRDYKPPLYVYSLMPSIRLFGLNEFGVRFPSAFFGTLTVLICYFLTKELFKGNIKNQKFKGLKQEALALTASFLLAISPWHLQFSRAGFEANLALFLTTTAILLLLKSFKKYYFLPISSLFFGLSLYTYHGARVFVPLIVLFSFFLFFKNFLKMEKILFLSVFIGLVISLPLIGLLGQKEISQRFQETSIFTSLNPIIESNQKIAEDGGGKIAKLVHHRFWEYGRIFLDEYFKHFNGSYLFLSGDGNPRHSTQEFGLLYHWEIISLTIALVILLKKPTKKTIFLLGWILIGIVPASLTKEAPHALRTLFDVPAFSILSAIGLGYLFKLFKNKKIFFAIASLLLTFDFLLYLHFYYHHYPKIYSSYWQYGYKQAINYINENENFFENIYLTNEYGRSYMYYLFYSQKDPVWIQKEIQPQTKKPDIDNIGKVHFGIYPGNNEKILLITSPSEIGKGELIKTIDFLNNKKAFLIWQE